MFTARRLRLIALTALASLAFAQAATAAMGCATLRSDTARGDVAVMPSGEPCEMMGSLPAQITLKAFSPDASATQFDAGNSIAIPALPVLMVPMSYSRLSDGPDRATPPPSILGPPPYLATLRLRV